jgi:cytochrome c biogenesis factor
MNSKKIVVIIILFILVLISFITFQLFKHNNVSIHQKFSQAHISKNQALLSGKC